MLCSCVVIGTLYFSGNFVEELVVESGPYNGKTLGSRRC